MNHEIKLSCDIVKDLIPSYIDKLTRDETTCAVEAHIAECASCREFLELLSEPEQVSGTPPKHEEPIRFLKKIKQKTILRVVIAAALAFAAMCVFIFLFFVNPLPLSAADISVGNIYRLSNGRIYWEVILEGPAAGIADMKYGISTGDDKMTVSFWYELADKVFKNDDAEKRVYHLLSPPAHEINAGYYLDETWDNAEESSIQLWDESDVQPAPPEIEVLKDQMTGLWVTPEHPHGTPTLIWDITPEPTAPDFLNTEHGA